MSGGEGQPPDGPRAPAKANGSDKQERLAARLRDNLKKRKEQARARDRADEAGGR